MIVSDFRCRIEVAKFVFVGDEEVVDCFCVEAHEDDAFFRPFKRSASDSFEFEQFGWEAVWQLYPTVGEPFTNFKRVFVEVGESWSVYGVVVCSLGEGS